VSDPTSWINADPLKVITSADVVGPESVEVTDRVDEGLAEDVVRVPMTMKDSFEYVTASPSFEYPNELETL
jgi:hypothetical protein